MNINIIEAKEAILEYGLEAAEVTYPASHWLNVFPDGSYSIRENSTLAAKYSIPIDRVDTDQDGQDYINIETIIKEFTKNLDE